MQTPGQRGDIVELLISKINKTMTRARQIFCTARLLLCDNSFDNPFRYSGINRQKTVRVCRSVVMLFKYCVLFRAWNSIKTFSFTLN